MAIKKFNEIVGCIIFFLGVAKTIYVITAFLLFGYNLVALFENTNVNFNHLPAAVQLILAFAEIIVLVLSIVMAFLNIKNQHELIKWYLLSIGAFLLEIFIPSIIFPFFVLPQCVMYLNSGVKIRNGAIGVVKNYKKMKQDIKNTEWFYGKEEEEDKKDEKTI